MTFRDPELNALERTLALYALELCTDILPAGRKHGNEWRCRSIHGEAGDSLGVHLDGRRAGWWADFAADHRGRGLLSLITAVACNGDFREAIKFARAWLGQDHYRTAAYARTVERRPRDASEPAVDFRDSARKIFFTAHRGLISTPVEGYLSGRAIRLGDLPRRPHFLRYKPRLLHKPTNSTFAGMVTAIVDQNGRFLAVHRTYLKAGPDGVVRKAPVDEPKMVLGPAQGGVIPVWPGTDGAAWPKITPGEKVAVTEGIEDALSLAVLLPHWRVIAAGFVGNMAKIILPPGIGKLEIAAQNDPLFNARGEVNETLSALDEAVRHFRRQGVEVGITRPPSGKDFNDYLQMISSTGEIS
jgi:hypothetical protein